MTVKEQIDKDLKTAMLAGDKPMATTLRGLKSAILYVEVAQNARETGLSEETVITLLQKEAKKRQESADMYMQGGSNDRAETELAEKAVIEKYLPEQLDDEEIKKIVTQAIAELGSDPQSMGKIIGFVKQKIGGAADGATIARLVKESLST